MPTRKLTPSGMQTKRSASAREWSVRAKSESKEESALGTDLDRLAAEIGARWATQVSAVEAVREGRREL